MKRTLLLIIYAVSLPVMAGNYPTQSEFYADAENAKKFASARSTGQLAKQSEMYSIGCIQGAKTDADKKLCDCAAEIVKTVPEKEMFYESYMAYTIFQDVVAAKREGNAEEYEALKKISRERNGLEKRIAASCG